MRIVDKQSLTSTKIQFLHETLFPTSTECDHMNDITMNAILLEKTSYFRLNFINSCFKLRSLVYRICLSTVLFPLSPAPKRSIKYYISLFNLTEPLLFRLPNNNSFMMRWRWICSLPMLLKNWIELEKLPSKSYNLFISAK